MEPGEGQDHRRGRLHDRPLPPPRSARPLGAGWRRARCVGDQHHHLGWVQCRAGPRLRRRRRPRPPCHQLLAPLPHKHPPNPTHPHTHTPLPAANGPPRFPSHGRQPGHAAPRALRGGPHHPRRLLQQGGQAHRAGQGGFWSLSGGTRRRGGGGAQGPPPTHPTTKLHAHHRHTPKCPAPPHPR